MKALFLFIQLFIFTLISQAQSMTLSAQLSSKGEIEFFQISAEGQAFVGLTAYSVNLNTDYDLYYSIQHNGLWSNWKAFKRYTEGEIVDRRSFEAPPILSDFEAIRFTSSGDAGMVHFRLFFPRTSQNVQEEPAQESSLACSCNTPAYCGRECWCPSGDCPKDATPTQTMATHIIVHHSAGFNTSQDFKQVVAYYWDFHTGTNGWDDIGYNWLIDPNGVVYEGRGDGTLGAHFSCMNTGTTGICMIGNFEDVAPSTVALNSLADLSAAISCKYNIDPSKSSYHASSQLDLQHISSHRDGNTATSPTSCAVGTECPGDSLYIKLPEIRQATAAKPCLALGIDKLDRANFSILSNPASGLNILIHKEGNYEVSVVNAVGQLVYTVKIESAGNRLVNLEPIGTAGIYLVSISDGVKNSKLRWEKL